jgi:hypothetical protein
MLNMADPPKAKSLRTSHRRTGLKPVAHPLAPARAKRHRNPVAMIFALKEDCDAEEDVRACETEEPGAGDTLRARFRGSGAIEVWGLARADGTVTPVADADQSFALKSCPPW